jgi:rod shape determining protein RodA
MTNFYSIIFSGIPIFLFSGLVILQPDFGSAILLLGVWFGMILLGGTKIIHIIYISILSLLSIAFAWFIILLPYQKQRVLTFFDPLADPLGSGYNSLQAMRAISSGGLMGRGIAVGNQVISVPEIHTDFIFAGFAQEWGLIGISVYFAVLIWIFTRLFFIAKATSDVFSRNLVIGAMVLLLLQTIVNIGMNIGILPITGTPLPFMSYGGSAMMSFFIVIGLVLSVDKHKQSEGTIYMNTDRFDFI